MDKRHFVNRGVKMQVIDESAEVHWHWKVVRIHAFENILTDYTPYAWTQIKRTLNRHIWRLWWCYQILMANKDTRPLIAVASRRNSNARGHAHATLASHNCSVWQLCNLFLFVSLSLKKFTATKPTCIWMTSRNHARYFIKLVTCLSQWDRSPPLLA